MMTTDIALLVMLAAAPPPDTPAALRPCPAASEQPSGALCGQVSVPENRAVNGGRQIALNVVVLPSRSAAGKSDPVFGLAGGPGFAATRLALSYPRLYDLLQNDHDIVLVDQRGTGASNPLFCSNADPEQSPARVLSEWPDDAALTQCRDRLAKIADLKQYTTSAAVDDLDAVRQALGYSRINLLGVSYGTRVALEYLRRYPARVRAAALNGVFPPAYRAGLNGPRESQQALQKLFSLCAADSTCSGAFPKLAADYATARAALDKAPANAAIPLPDGQMLNATLSRSVFVRELGILLMFREDLMALPLVIHAAGGGDFMPFAALALSRELSRNLQADGLMLSVQCASDPQALSAAAVTAATRDTFAGDARARFLKRACAIWPRGTEPAAMAAPVRSETPVLLISGALDPVTPPPHAEEVVKLLPGGLHVVVANVGHVPANPCVHGMIAGFLKTGTAKGLDTGCAAAFPALKFATAMPKVQ